MAKTLDAIAIALTALIGLLLATGGVRYGTPTLKLELSEIDAFAWILLVVLTARRYFFGAWLPARLEHLASRGLRGLEVRPLTSVLVGSGAYVIFETWNSLWRYDSFQANAFDLGFVDQALWSSANGEFLRSSLSKGSNYLGEHFSPILGVVGQIYRFTDSVSVVFLIQSLALASVAPLVYLLGRKMKLSRGLSALAALCLLGYQPLRLANGFDFREDNLFVPIFLGALLALESRRLAVFWTLMALSWTIKESAPVFTCLAGLWLLVEGMRTRDRKLVHGAALALASLVVFVIINVKVTPHFAGAGPEGKTMLAKRLSRFGESNPDIVFFALRHPLDFLIEAFRPILGLKAVKYTLDVLIPFVWFMPMAVLPALIALAGVSLNLLVNQPTIGFHYECVLIPFLSYVLVRGLSKFDKRTAPAKPQLAALVALSFLLFFGRSPVESIRRHCPTEHDRFVAGELAKIEPALSVATQSALFAHLDHRRDIALFSRTAPSPDVIALDFSPDRDRYASANIEADAAAIDSRQYRLVTDRDQLKIWRRK